MKNKKISNLYKDNFRFIDSAVLNESTYIDYLERFRRVALSVFEWVNLPSSMDGFKIEESLYYTGECSLLKDENYGFINTRCSHLGGLNIYDRPTKLNCYANQYNAERKVYTGFISEDENLQNEFNECILIENNIDKKPTCGSMELFAYRLYEAEQTAFININAQKTPVLILVNEKQLLTLKNFYKQYEGNMPVIFGTKESLEDKVEALKTDAPFIADKIIDYKKEIWNEALTFLGINNIMVDKKERLITDEANSNNELINLNLQSFLAPREKACKQFNEKFKPENPISVRVRSDLHNIIKNNMSVVSNIEDTKEGVE